MAAGGNHAFVTALEGGLRIVDVSDPTDPILVATWDPGLDLSRVAVEGDRAYVLCSIQQWNWIKILDVSDPTQPLELGEYDAPLGLVDLAVHVGS